ncbi:MAG: hypothetical protein ACXIUZ_01895 [Lysobacteraceae bacterium]
MVGIYQRIRDELDSSGFVSDSTFDDAVRQGLSVAQVVAHINEQSARIHSPIN